MNFLLQMNSCVDAGWPLQAPDDLIRAMVRAGRMLRLEPECRLFSFGDKAEGVYLIVKGTVRATLPGALGREIVCLKAGPGSALGLPSALCAESYQFDVEALDGVEARFLPTKALNKILRKQPELCLQVMSRMCNELSAVRKTREHIRIYGRRFEFAA